MDFWEKVRAIKLKYLKALNLNRYINYFSFVRHPNRPVLMVARLLFEQLDDPVSGYNATYINHSSPHSPQTTNSPHTYSQVSSLLVTYLTRWLDGTIRIRMRGNLSIYGLQSASER